jgi:very-short-patch-repair endonuclease
VCSEEPQMQHKHRRRNLIIPYNPHLKKRARELRKQGTLSEVLLWKAIQRKQLGVEFHRQVPLDEYIVDFYCHELHLPIEVDGVSHDSEEKQQCDLKRQQRLEGFGVRFLRFTDDEIKESLEGVVERIREEMDEALTSP